MGMSGQLDSGMQIDGATDNTAVGNVGDRLKVDISGTATAVTVDYPTFVVSAISTATALNKSMLSLVNTTGSTVKLRIREVRIINTQTTAVLGIIATFCIFRCVTHSVGTAITPLSHDTSDTLSGSITARTGATIGTESTGILRCWQWSTDEWGGGVLDVESSDHSLQSLIPAVTIPPKTKPITLNANEGITLKCTTNTTTGIFDILVIFTQE